MEYEILRKFADTWGLLFLVSVFLFVVVWVFRPGSKKIYKDQSNILFRHEKED